MERALAYRDIETRKARDRVRFRRRTAARWAQGLCPRGQPQTERHSQRRRPVRLLRPAFAGKARCGVCAAVYDDFDPWERDGTPERLRHKLYVANRDRGDRERREAGPSAVVISGQSAGAAQNGGVDR